MVQVWRGPEDGRLSLFNVYLLAGYKWAMSGAKEGLDLYGLDPNWLLQRRHVVQFSGTAQTQKTDYIDDMMKEVVSENFVSSIWSPTAGATLRNWTSFAVDPQNAFGPVTSREFAWQNVLQLLKDLAGTSKEQGTEVFFEVVPVVELNTISFLFRTYTGQPRIDMSSYGVLFDQARGNMRDPFYEVDYSQEINYAYGRGQGEEEDALIQEAGDAARYRASKWAFSEGVANGRSGSTAEAVLADARAALRLGRPRQRFGAQVVDTQGVQFGRDWGWGYRVRARYRQEYVCLVRTVALSVADNNEEQIDARLEWEG
jgi:hypothetical protein